MTPAGAKRPQATVLVTNLAEESSLQCPDDRKTALLRGSLSKEKG